MLMEVSANERPNIVLRPGLPFLHSVAGATVDDPYKRTLHVLSSTYAGRFNATLSDLAASTAINGRARNPKRFAGRPALLPYAHPRDPSRYAPFLKP